MEDKNNIFPDIEFEYDDQFNPSISSPNATFSLQFYQTKESMMEIETYKRFLDNAISRFRHSRTYKNYKKYLYDIGLNRCQILPNIDSDMADLEMHHVITIFDIALLITEHILNTRGYISTFELVQLLKEEHKANRIPLVMLCHTVHQSVHNTDDIFIPAQMCFGYWQELILRYPRGITVEFANKLIDFIGRSVEYDQLDAQLTKSYLELRDNVEGWSRYNEYSDMRKIDTISYS